MKYVNRAGGEIIMPSDIVAANQMHDANGNMVVLEDY